MNCVHLDFHTSPDIEDIGAKFDKEKFSRTVKDAHIDLMTVFAKCHHGYSFYPTRVGTMHPHLKFNLLKEEIEAIHAAGAKAPIYITAGWSKKDADEHPEWHHIDFHTKRRRDMGTPVLDDPSSPLPHCSWVTLCLVGSYADYLEEITREVCENFDVSDGVFYDICFVDRACACESCKAGMLAKGLDPDNYNDACRYYDEKRVELMKRLTGVVKSYAPEATVFYNGGANMYRPVYHPYQTHFELEDLPTAWGGYDLMPLRAKYFERYGKHYLGMTGKFHNSWGEFGGFKNKNALKYECADMLSVGASISVGDHLHPLGELDESTYRVIGHAFSYVDKIKKYTENTKTYTDLAIWLSGKEDSDMGASKLLQNMHQEFDVVVAGDDISRYGTVILPDYVQLSEADKKRLLSFYENGGTVIASYESIIDEFGIKKIAPSEYDTDFIKCDVEDYTTPFLSYSKAYRVESDGEVLAEVYEPYFSRTGMHFCGHKNTPNKPVAADYPALVKRGRVLYFAHPVFEAYNNSGNYVLERYVIKGIGAVYDTPVKCENLPSVARARVRYSESGKFLALHLLYAPPVNRGDVCLLPDFPTLHDVKITLKTDKKIKEVFSASNGISLDFTQNGDGVSFSVDPFSLHNLIVLKW